MGTRQGCGAGSSAWRIVANSVPCRAEQLGHGHCNRAFSGVGERLDSPRFRTAGLFGLKPHDVLVRPARVPGHTSSSGTTWRTGITGLLGQLPQRGVAQVLVLAVQVPAVRNSSHVSTLSIRS